VFALFDIDEQGRCGSEHVPIIVENLVLSSYFWDSTLVGSFDQRILGSGFSGLSFVPEPATLGLLTLGGLAIMRRRRYRPSSPALGAQSAGNTPRGPH
jgi:hypothetical protein